MSEAEEALSFRCFHPGMFQLTALFCKGDISFSDEMDIRRYRSSQDAYKNSMLDGENASSLLPLGVATCDLKRDDSR
jgi:hypothetical protein